MAIGWMKFQGVISKSVHLLLEKSEGGSLLVSGQLLKFCPFTPSSWSQHKVALNPMLTLAHLDKTKAWNLVAGPYPCCSLRGTVFSIIKYTPPAVVATSCVHVPELVPKPAQSSMMLIAQRRLQCRLLSVSCVCCSIWARHFSCTSSDSLIQFVKLQEAQFTFVVLHFLVQQ